VAGLFSLFLYFWKTSYRRLINALEKNFDLPAGIPDLSIPLDYKISGDRRPTLSHYGTCGRAVKQ
jgi:hypothetical protein